MKKILIALLCSGVMWGQNNRVTLQASAPSGVPTINLQLVGNQGPATWYYWVVSNFPIGQVGSGSAQIINAPNVFSGSNYVNVSWSQNGAVNYDVLKTATPVLPNSCTCAI